MDSIKPRTIETCLFDKVFNIDFNFLNENNNTIERVLNFPINKKIKYDRDKMITAIKYGMVLLILYKGDKDRWLGGRERIIYPMVLGINKNTNNELLRGWHVSGYSIKYRKEVKREWRLFKTKNIKGMMFIGKFFRLPPEGYKMNDSVMTERIIISANFNNIIKNQNELLKHGNIEFDDVDIKDKKGISPKRFNRILVSRLNEDLILGGTLKTFGLKTKDVKISFLKHVFSNKIIAVLGLYVDVYDDYIVNVFNNNINMGSYNIIKSVKYDELIKLNHINNIKKFEFYELKKIL